MATLPEQANMMVNHTPGMKAPIRGMVEGGAREGRGKLSRASCEKRRCHEDETW